MDFAGLKARDGGELFPPPTPLRLLGFRLEDPDFNSCRAKARRWSEAESARRERMASRAEAWSNGMQRSGGGEARNAADEAPRSRRSCTAKTKKRAVAGALGDYELSRVTLGFE